MEVTTLAPNSHEAWNTLEISTVVILGILGTIMNLLFILAFIIDDKLRHHSNLFWVTIILNDLVMTIAGTTLLVMMHISDHPHVCQIFQIMAQSSTYNTNIFYMIISLYFRYRLSRLQLRNKHLLKFKVIALTGLAIVTNITVSYIGANFGLDTDYCHRLHAGHYWFRLLTRTVYYVVPSIITCYQLVKTKDMTDSRCQNLNQPDPIFEEDRILVNLHIGCWLLFILTWIPYMLVELYELSVTDKAWHVILLCGLIRSNVTSLIYVIVLSRLRQIVINLLKHIFCCKQC